jgi:uncharacterized protein (TIGR02444 family)
MSDHNTDRGVNGTPLDADAFWNFASDLYGDPGVAGACLHLQDSCGARVNLLLLALWFADRKVAPTNPEVIAQAADGWHHSLVMPLRVLRRSLKEAAAADPDVADLRRDLQAAELRGERIEQRRLIAVAQIQAASSTAWLEPVLRNWAGVKSDADVRSVHALVTALGHPETKTK